jgi:hypothetical protein
LKAASTAKRRSTAAIERRAIAAPGQRISDAEPITMPIKVIVNPVNKGAATEPALATASG